MREDKEHRKMRGRGSRYRSRRSNTVMIIGVVAVLLLSATTLIFALHSLFVSGSPAGDNDRGKGSGTEAAETSNAGQPGDSQSSEQDSDPEDEAEPRKPIKGDFYYRQLTEQEQSAYKKIVKKCRKFSEEIDVEAMDLTVEETWDVLNAIRYDRPEYFWMVNNNTVNHYEGGNAVSVTVEIPEKAREDKAAIDEITEEIVRDIPSGSSDYEAVKYIYDWIVDNTDYGSNEEDQNISSVFLRKQSVCAGYSNAFALLCHKAGIRCTTVSGTKKGGESHAWNLVYLEDEPYWVDVTWGDPVFMDPEGDKLSRNYIYFCMDDKELFKTHTIEKSFEHGTGREWDYPSCSSHKFDYYRYHDMFFEESEEGALEEYIRNRIDAGEEKNIEMKFGSEKAFRQAEDHLFGENAVRLAEIVHGAISGYSDPIRFRHMEIEEAGYIQLSLELEM